MHEALRVVAARASLEAVEQHDQRRFRGTSYPVELDEITVGRLPLRAAVVHARPRAQHGCVDRLRVAAWQPAWRPVGPHVRFAVLARGSEIALYTRSGVSWFMQLK